MTPLNYETFGNTEINFIKSNILSKLPINVQNEYKINDIES